MKSYFINQLLKGLRDIIEIFIKMRDETEKDSFDNSSIGAVQNDLSSEEQKKLDAKLLRVYYSASSSDHKKVKELLEQGANVDVVNNEGDTPLMWACFMGDKPVVELLIGRGVDVNVKNNSGNTALDFASSKKHEGIVELLLKHGATK